MNYVDINEVPSFGDTLPMQLYRTLDAIMPEYRNLFAKNNLLSSNGAYFGFFGQIIILRWQNCLKKLFFQLRAWLVF